MRCPKCQYISFDSGDRCRNCGYEFSLSSVDTPVDVTIARDEPAPGRIRDGALTALDAPLASRTNANVADADENLRSRPLPTAEDLPLFTERVADDQAPLVTPPAVPRQPLSVRRATHAGRPRPRPPESDALPLGLGAEPDDARSLAESTGADAARGHVADIVRRAVAGLIDVAVLAGIHASVVYLTLRACELTPDQWRALPLVPLVAFLLMLCGGYFVLFTAAGGQTIGKMIAGIRVVAASPSDESHSRVSFNAAFVRAVACLGSLAALGTGFLPVLMSADRRAFHDRVADTRVVSA